MDYKKFNVAFLAVALVLLAGAAGYNIIADPYGVYRVGDWVGINRYAEQGEAMERMAKPLAAASYQAGTLIVGNSVSNIGLDPHDYEELTGSRTYNLSVDSARPYEMRRYVEHMLAVDSDLREVLACVDITTLYPVKDTQEGFDEQQIGYRHQVPSAFARTALSLDACEAGWSSVRLNRSQRLEYPSHEANGMVSEGQQARNYGPVWFYKFLQMNLRTGSERNRRLALENLDEYRKMRDMCAEKGVAFRILIPPMSAAARVAFADFYGEEAIRAFVQALAEIAPCHDFSSIGPWNEQASAADRSLFWDAHHMKPVLGKFVLAVLAGQEAPLGWEGFGVLLGSVPIQDYVARQAEICAAWRMRHPRLWHEVSHMGIFAPEHQALPEPSDGLVHLDEVNGGTWPTTYISCKSGDTLTITGWSACLPRKRVTRYLALRDAAGHWYTTLTAPVKREDLVSLTHDQAYMGAGFTVEASFADLEPGDYGLYLWEEAESASHLSGQLGVVRLARQARL